MGSHSQVYLPMMNTLLLFLLLVPLVLAKPQGGHLVNTIEGFLGRAGATQGDGGSLRNVLNKILSNPVIQSRVLKSEFNPCQGQPPSQCTCTNEVTFVPASIVNINKGNPCGGVARPDTCTCPQGNTFRAEDVADNVATKYEIPNCGKGVEPSSCKCRDGSTFTVRSNQVPCGGNPFQVDSCSCPDGSTIQRKDFIKAAIPLIQHILG